ncbi:MAG: tRNA-intron lyase [Candidatus Hydrothermarchaeales archaeon]
MAVLLLEDKIVVDDEASIDKLSQKGFGKQSGDTLELSSLEALYLVERGSISVTQDGNEVPAADLAKRLDERDFSLRYRVYSDLRDRGYVLKTGFKFGAHFRVYERGGFPKEHSKYLVHAVPEDYSISLPEVARAVRLAQGVKKTLIFAAVDEDGDVTYYSIDRITP